MNGLTNPSVSLEKINIQGKLASVSFVFTGLGASPLPFTVFLEATSSPLSVDLLIRKAREIVSTKLHTILGQLESAADLPWESDSDELRVL